MTEVRRRGRPGQAEPVAQKGAQALERELRFCNIWKKWGSSSVSDISLNLDLPLSTTFRLLKVLQAADFVYQDSQLGWWHIGLGVFNVGAAYIHNRDVLSVAGPFMRRLMLLSGETVNVAIRNGNEAVLIGQLECKSMVRMCAPLGSRLPLHASGAGKALLYPLAEEELMSIILQTGLQQFTPTTLVDMPTLLKDLEQARELGYTVDKEEHVVGLNCIASAIYDDVGSVVAAISISGPSSRLTEDRFVSQGELVRDTARDISTALGLKSTSIMSVASRSAGRFFDKFESWKNFPINRGRNKMAKMRAVDAAMYVLEKEGITTAFGVPGAAINPFYSAMRKHGGIRHILARHVEGASHMAEGYTRATAGNIGVCLGTSGPAGTDMITALYSASADSIPILCITGQAPRARLHKEDFQAVDIEAIAKPVSKMAVTVREAALVPRVLQQAFHLMRSGRPGPVLVDLPFDVQVAEIEFDPDMYEPLPVYKPAASRMQIEKAVEMLIQAERPVIVAGAG